MKIVASILDNLGFEKEVYINDAKQRVRVLQYYLPVTLWLYEQVLLLKKVRPQDDPDARLGAICVGICLPQGGGKTTITGVLQSALNDLGLKTEIVSYDDFYLTYKEQQAVAKANPDNLYWQGRGVAGTHDLDLGVSTIKNMVYAGWDGDNFKPGQGDASSREIKIPVYEKSLNSGQGDRKGEEEWIRKEGPIDLVLVEGWMLGYKPIDPNSEVIVKNPGMKEVNEALKEYQKWDELFDAAMIIGVENSKVVFQWREEAEKVRRD
mmetsp:Transcript_12236/g.20595  ORF Transcript_12236/g.20595 Transcript_12236/m.20595 type:complete len:265 (-) Transcript_12236:260-1054(-)|eukprot:CAMPEP_0168615696 /NCGR_PEP_ID=MMETSP0449_2-20121227/4638_1 /TAXON_ID=1082188 /ORGANISM="Strombidium rassoulzadegani, Strain ras09" /LENGTH=264 /DNA_ID=CAMNT_0008656445 /DNA_START=688 /DNA_END=1482 /DNA_ORIENTATION=+